MPTGARRTARASPPIRLIHPGLVQPESRDSLAHDSGSASALLTLLQTILLTGLSVAREREQGTFDQLLVTPFRPAEIMAGKAVPPMLVGIVQATLVLLVAQLWFRIPVRRVVFHALRGLSLFLLAAVGHRTAALLGGGDHAAGDALFVSVDHAVRAVIGIYHADQQHAGAAAVPHVDQSAALRHRDRSSGLSRGSGTCGCCCRSFGRLAIIAAVTLSAASWMFRHRLM